MPKFRLGTLKMSIVRRKRIIALVVAWGVIISSIMIKSHWLYYLTNKRFNVYKISWQSYEGPKFDDLDLILLLVTSFAIGTLVADIKQMVYGYFAAILLSAAIGIGYIFFYDWFALKLGETLASSSFGWEWGAYVALLNIFRFMFPMGMFCCLVGLVAGIFLKTLARL